VNWIDTAPIYGSGHSEEVVGRAIKALPASRRPYVFTKFGLGVNVDAPDPSLVFVRERGQRRPALPDEREAAVRVSARVG